MGGVGDGVWDLGFRRWGGFGVWGAGFGVWDLGFWFLVWGLRIWVFGFWFGV